MGHRIHRRGIIMSAAAFVDRARQWERVLVTKEAARTGLPSTAAREKVAHRVGALPGTLENLRRGRLKEVAAQLYAGLHAGVIADLEAELRHVQHELDLARQQGLDPRSGSVFSLVANEARLKTALGLTPAPDGEGT
jgi:hypothetical protein